MNRFFVDKKNINEDTIIITDIDEIKHISKVLRLKVDEKIEISDGEAYEYIGKITEIAKDYVEVEIIEKKLFQREPSAKITIYQGVPKQSKMEYIVQKSVELGVCNVIPVFTERTVVQDKGNFDKKVERWSKIAYESAKQCKRGVIPIIGNPLSFDEMLSQIQDKDLVLFLYESEIDIKIKDILRKFDKAKQIAIIVGPEGGFSEEEASKAVSSGAVSVSLGKTILRTETAGAVALAIVLYELEG